MDNWHKKGLKTVKQDINNIPHIRKAINYVEELKKRVSSKFKISEEEAGELIDKTSDWNITNEDDMMWIIENKLLKR